MSTAEIIDFEQRHADDAFYVAIEPLCTQLEAEMPSFGLNAAECYLEVHRLLDMIIEKGENFIRNIDKSASYRQVNSSPNRKVPNIHKNSSKHCNRVKIQLIIHKIRPN